MPYHIVKHKDGEASVVKDTGEVVTRHDTYRKALKHLRALYANVPDAKVAGAIVVDEDEPILKESSAYDEEHWAKLYRETGNKDYRDKALGSMKNIVYKTTQGYNRSNSINQKSFFYKGMGIAKDAIETWDPEQAKLSTHVVNQLKQLYRTVYKLGTDFKIPEHRIANWQQIENALYDYMNEYGEGEYDPQIISNMSGIPVEDVKKALQERRSVYNDSTLTTTDIKWVGKNYKNDLDLFEQEFRNDPDKSKIFAEIKKIIEKGGKPNATKIANTLGMDYFLVNKYFREIVEKIQEGLVLN